MMDDKMDDGEQRALFEVPVQYRMTSSFRYCKFESTIPGHQTQSNGTLRTVRCTGTGTMYSTGLGFEILN